MDISLHSARRVATGPGWQAPVHRASRSREAGANDRQVTLACFSIDGKRGSVLDRNVELPLIVPGPASAAAP